MTRKDLVIDVVIAFFVAMTYWLLANPSFGWLVGMYCSSLAGSLTYEFFKVRKASK